MADQELTLVLLAFQTKIERNYVSFLAVTGRYGVFLPRIERLKPLSAVTRRAANREKYFGFTQRP